MINNVSRDQHLNHKLFGLFLDFHHLCIYQVEESAVGCLVANQNTGNHHLTVHKSAIMSHFLDLMHILHLWWYNKNGNHFGFKALALSGVHM